MKKTSPKDWQVRVRVWVERAGKAVLGRGRLELLEGIERCHSISAAARDMGMSYRRAWLLVQSSNEAAGFPLVETATGGMQGGGARLTAAGKAALAAFRAVQERLNQAAASALMMPAGAADTVHVAAAVSLEEVLSQLSADYAAAQPGRRVRVVLGASDELAEQLLHARGGIDVFLSAAREPADQLAAAGRLDARSLTVLAENRLAVLGGARSRSAIRQAADLCKPAVGPLALANPSCPLGRYAQDYLKAEGLFDQLRSRILYVDNPRSVVGALHAGRADVGMVYQSDAATAGDCQVLFRVRRPPAPIRYWAALTDQGRASSQAREFLAFVTSAAAWKRFRDCGFLPPSNHG